MILRVYKLSSKEQTLQEVDKSPQDLSSLSKCLSDVNAHNEIGRERR